MTVWYKQGVTGRLNPHARKCLGRIHTAYQERGEDLFITSIEEGNHGAGSLHYCGDAFDFRYSPHVIPNSDIRAAAGCGFDVCFEKSHIHIEYDPKNEVL